MASTTLELPYAPPGSNVFEFYKAPVKALFHLEPAKGLKARLIVTLLLAITLLCLGTTYSICQYLIRRRVGARWWLWKRVDRKAGSFIIVNPMAGKEIMCFYLPLFGVVQVALVWQAYFTHAVTLSSVMIWAKTCSWPCLFLAIWHSLWANLHVYLQLRDDTTGPLRFLNAKVANALFVGGAILGAATLTTTTIISTLISNKVVTSYAALATFVAQAASEWQVGDDVTAKQATVRALWINVEQTINHHLRVSGYMWGITCIFYITVFAVNLAAFPLIVSLRRQIAASLEDLQPQTLRTVHAATPGGGPDLSDFKMNRKVPTIAQIKAMADRQSAGLESAKRLRSMARSAKDLQVHSTAAIVMITCQTTLAISFSVVYKNLRHMPSGVTELVIFGPLWAVLLPVTIAFAKGFTPNAVQEARGQMVEVREETPAGGVQLSLGVGGAGLEKGSWVDEQSEDPMPLGLLPTIVGMGALAARRESDESQPDTIEETYERTGSRQLL